MKDLLELSGKKILIAGIGGIGSEVCRLLSELGCDLILVDVNEERIIQAIEFCDKCSICHYICDFLDINCIEELSKKIVLENGALDGIVFCSGYGESRPLKQSRYDYMLKTMNINFFSYIEMIRCFSKKGAYNNNMSIVGISSVGAFLGNPGQIAYSASKAAMNGATRSIAKELSIKNIRVNTIAPGTTDTEMFRLAEKNFSESESFNSRVNRQYLGLCVPNDIANAVVFLLSKMSRMITGNCIPVDGGKLSS